MIEIDSALSGPSPQMHGRGHIGAISAIRTAIGPVGPAGMI
jgi:hypothetical protein